jgi:phosphoglycolate phosphatase-like HAD superfamily hydrolase
MSLHAAIRSVHGLDESWAPSKVESAGRCDGAIARAILEASDVPATTIDRHAAAVFAAACEEFAQRCPTDLTPLLSPGIVPVLDSLASRDGVRLSLVTGNLEPVARLKLDRAGIGHYFPAGQGGFGSDSEDRSILPGLARIRAGGDAGPHPAERTIVIGDTPRDIACARADGNTVVAVATGPFPASELTDADLVVVSADQLPAALESLGVPAA